MSKIQATTKQGYKVIGEEYDRSPDGKYIWIENETDIYVCLASTVEEIKEAKESKQIKEDKKAPKMTLKKLVKIAKEEIKEQNLSSEEIEECSITELLQKTTNIVKEHANELVTISHNDFELLNESIYSSMNGWTLEEMQTDILLTVLEYEVIGIHKTVRDVKRELLEEIKEMD